MPVRALQARIECGPEELQSLWRTHRVFNERLPTLIKILFQMNRGECGDSEEKRKLYQEIGRFVLSRDARDGWYLLNSVSIPNWKPGTARKMRITVPDADGNEVEVSGETWAVRAAAISAQGELLYNKRALLGDLPETLRQMVVRESVAIVRGHQELVKRWQKEHEDWLKRKALWEADPEHQKYLVLRPRFEAFEECVDGKAGKRRERWHRYLDWLRGNPDLAAWRCGPSGVVELSAEAKARIRKAKPRKARSIEAEEFWKANPELAALDRLHGYYERTFVRRRKTKKNPDGFDHRPTFTLPHAVRHPHWFVFNAPQTDPQGYKDLMLPGGNDRFGAIRLLLLTGGKDGDRHPQGWVQLRFAADPRLADFAAVMKKRPIRKGKSKGQETEGPAYVFLDRQLGLERPARISGVKLIFRNVRVARDGSLDRGAPYLVFTCNIDDVPLSDGAKAVKWADTGEKRKKIMVPGGLVTCAVDLGIRNLGFVTIAVRQEGASAPGLTVVRSRSIWVGEEEETGRHPGRWSRGPELDHLSDHKRELRRLRRLRGKPVRGEDSHLELQQHITHMAEDRFKKSARQIVNFALNVEVRIDKKTGKPYPAADVLIVENLANLLPDAARERGINSALIEFNRGHLVDRLKEAAKDCGLKLIEVSPVGTSQVCCRCGALGRRYSIRRDPATGIPDICFGFVEKLFACLECGYRADSDHNASVNLHRRLIMGDRAVENYYLGWQQKSPKERAAAMEAMEAKLRPLLRKMHGLDTDEVPF